MHTIRSYNKRLELLRSERSTFFPTYRELSDYHLSHRGRFLTSDRNKGHKRNTRQINNKSRLAARTMASGMMSGITSPARPWFRLSTGDNELDDLASVKAWLYQVQTTLYKVFALSNMYNSLHQVYLELGVFGTAAMGVYQDFENVIWCKPYTVGSYMLGTNGQNITDTMYREYELTAGQVVKQFGMDNVSKEVKRQWDTGNTEAWVKIIHVIEPNDDRDNLSILASDKPWRSVYYEQIAKSTGNSGRGPHVNGDSGDKFLRESGFDEFPIMTPRWDVTGEDIYATDCPGIIALGDTKALQLGERRLYQAIDKVVDPPLQGTPGMKNLLKSSKLSPGQIVFTESKNDPGLRSVYENFRPDINAIRSINVEAEQRISRAFYEDLFLLLANSDRRQMTAREVVEKHEEKLLMLGPVLERLHNELLDPLIDRTFNILQENGVFPLPPPELQNKELRVEYVSVLAQAQRMANTESIAQIADFTASMANLWPETRFKIDPNQAIDDYADAIGVNPAMIKSNDDAQAQASQEAQADQQQQVAAQAAAAADMAKTASETAVGDSTLLDRAIEQTS